jgi:murein DD-endopeptidase MepM/ murein hydrolase activator NlpD
MRSNLNAYWLLLVLLPLISGCRKEIVPKPYYPSNAHDAYRHSLHQAKLAETALGREWIYYSRKALQEIVEIEPPFEEIFYVSSTSAYAVAYGFAVKRGQRIEVVVTAKTQKPGRIFIDLFRVEGSVPSEWPRIASANEKELRLEFEPRRNAKYVLRLQPELLRGGQYHIVIRNRASLDFPVSGRTSRSIKSGFGEPRDGGKRRHHGVDIFAPRHTPVLAPSKSYVHHVGQGRRGGSLIWLLDPNRSVYFYFAHLETQKVMRNTWVEPGQCIGTVGNSGNARTTSPHLHFGIYVRGEGPVDPFYFIHQPMTKSIPVTADERNLGQWVRTKLSRIGIKKSFYGQHSASLYLDKHSVMKVMAAAGRFYRVMLPDGTRGYVLSKSVEPVGVMLHKHRLSGMEFIKEMPEKDSISMELLNKGEEYFILGKYKDFWFVKTQEGSFGWMPITEKQA